MRKAPSVRLQRRISRGSLAGVSRGTLAVLLLSVPVAAHAAGFAGTPTVIRGSATISSSGNTQTVSIPTTSQVTTINWVPTNAPSNGSINFLPAGNTVSYVGDAAATVPYTVLNRIIPTTGETNIPVAFYGSVVSTPNTRLWFYSPGGLLIGGTANFNVGGLVLTAADPVTGTDPTTGAPIGGTNGNFLTETTDANNNPVDNFSVISAAGSQSAITIQPGANIQAINSGQSNYIVAIAPQISQAGKIAVAGSVALVAAESATFAVDQNGLFNISVTSGTTVAGNPGSPTFSNTGSTGGPGVDPQGQFQRVYMVAVPKNTAITMAIASSGTIGFDVADAANFDGSAIVLSAGGNIADTGSGNPVVPGYAGTGTSTLTVGGGNVSAFPNTYTSNTYAVATDSASVTDSQNGIGFASNLTVIAPQASVIAQSGNITVGGNLIVNADNINSGSNGARTSALVETQNYNQISVGNNAYNLGVNGDLMVTADDTLGGVGGSASVQVNSGSIEVTDSLLVSANGSWANAVQNNSTGPTQGGAASVSVTNGGYLYVGNGLTVSASADATNADNYYDNEGTDPALAAVGGIASVTVNGQYSSLYANGITATASALSSAPYYGDAGPATGGAASILAQSQGNVTSFSDLSLDASATGATSYYGNGGNAVGGTIQLGASGGGSLNAPSTFASVAASGGSGSGNGGNAMGGNIFIQLGNNGFNFDSVGSSPELDASFIAGQHMPSDFSGSNGTASTAGGVLITAVGGSANLAGSLTIDNNTPLYVQADGSLNVTGSITAAGDGAYLHLWADDLGSGSGNVTLANGALNLTGNGNQTDIYYNPGSLGNPMDFSGGFTAGSWTAYQLVDNITQLQQVGNYPSQNFALGANINASATQGWNDGAGFVPIGNSTTPFTGNFDGLNHTITNLTINTPTSNFVGLFGDVDSSTNNVIIRNVGLVGENITGNAGVGGLIGGAGTTNSPNDDQITISNDYTSGQINGFTIVGGLIGEVDTLYSPSIFGGTVSNSHSNANVLATQSVNNASTAVGGLIGVAEGVQMTDNFATGSVTAPGIGPAAGGLVGVGYSVSIVNAYATGSVTIGGTGSAAGGLVGVLNTGSVGEGNGPASYISEAYSTGTVTAATGASAVGSLVGFNVGGTINDSWASGTVSAAGSSYVGGFVGFNTGTITNSYWDTYSTGQANGAGFNAGTIGTTGLTSVTSEPGQPTAFNSNYYGNLTPGDWVYDNGNTRPIGAWEVPVAFFGVATIDSGHQLQLIDFNLGGSYTITQNIDLSDTAGTNDIWGPGGFQPLGHVIADPPFTGTLEGGGHVLSNLTMAPGPGYFNVGLIQNNEGTISDLGLYNVDITSAYVVTLGNISRSNVGAIAGINAGTITDSFATGTITLTGSADTYNTAGGLVGLNADASRTGNSGLINQSYATVTVSGGANVGGLVGDNEGSINETYANGSVSGAGEGSNVGGLVGASFDDGGPTITNSYWNSDNLAPGSLGCGTGCAGTTALNTAQMLQASYFTGFNIDTVGGQGLPWRQYNGGTTPLLEAFLTPITVQPGTLTTQYDAQVQTVGVTTYGAQPGLTFGAANVPGQTNVLVNPDGSIGTYALGYAGGLYSNQLGYDFVPSTTPGSLTITQAPLTLSAVNDTKTYDSTTNSAGQPTYSGTFGEDNVTNLTQSFTSPNVMGAGNSTLVVNSGYVINDGNGGNNYSVTVQNAAGTINPATLTLAAVGDTKTYDATTNSAGQPTYSGTFGDDSVTNLTQSFTSPNVMGANGSTLVVNSGYVINDGNGGNNYTVTFQNAAGTINPATLTLAAVGDTKTYNATTNSAGQPTYSGTFGDDSVTNLTQSFTSPNVMGANGSTLVVNSGYVINDGNGGNNYTVTFQNAAGTINPATLTLAAVGDTKTYNATPNSAGQPTYSGTFGDDSVTNLTQSFTSPNVMGANGSTLVVNSGYVINDGNGGNNYTVTFQNAAGTINPATLTLAAVGDTKTYNATPNSAGQPTYSGTFGDDSVTNLTQSFTSPNVMGANGSTLVVNSGYVINDGNGGNNYTVTFQNAAGTINPATLTLAAVSDTKTYDATTLSSGIVQVSGLQGTDQVLGASQSFDSANAGSRVLSVNNGYTIADGNSGGNYTVTLLTAPGQITPASLAITYTADPLSSIYGNAVPAVSGSVGAQGLQGSDTLAQVTSGAASFVTTANAQSNAGSYAITGSGLAANSGNYSFSFAQAAGNATALTIVPRALTLTADPLSRSYGGTNPTTDTATETPGIPNTGLVNGDTVSSETVTSPALATSSVGLYALNGSAAVFSQGLASNYAITYAINPGGLAVNPAALTIVYTANSASRVYGAANPAFTGSESASGLVNGDTLGSVTSGSAVFNSTATAASSVGSYAINGSGLSGINSNYTYSFSQAPGNATALTVNPAALTILYTANPASRAYGAANPALTGTETASGLVNGDTLGSVTSGAAAFNTPATTTASVGNYAINGSGLSGSSANYTYSYAQAEGNATALTINPAALTITYTANPASSIYGDVPTGLSGTETAAGLVNGDTLDSVTSGTASFTTPATGQTSVGSYAINGSGLTANSSNYSLSFTQAEGNSTALTITPRPITVYADPQQRYVGTPNPVFTYIVTGSGGTTEYTTTTAPGLVNGDQLTGQLASTATIASPVGTYDILQGTLAASSNYQLTYIGNILTVLYGSGTPLISLSADIEANLPDQIGNSTPEERKKQLEDALIAALYSGIGLYPPEISQSMINDQLVTRPPPVNEPVTTNGNSSLWNRGAP